MEFVEKDEKDETLAVKPTTQSRERESFLAAT